MKFSTPKGQLDIAFKHLIVAGWTGRDRKTVDHHIEELAAIGVSAPSTVPLYYQCSEDLLTQSSRISVLGNETSGEAEPFIVKTNNELWLGLASDHTDRALETYCVAHSKQICAKPVADTLWPMEEIAPHLEEIMLQSEIVENGVWVSYQSGTLQSILPIGQLIEGASLEEGAAMLCGTLGAIGGVRPASNFRMMLIDPVAKRQIEWSYSIHSLSIIS